MPASVAFQISAYTLLSLPVVAPLAVACLALVIVTPALAARGKLHIPAYVGLAFLTFLLAMLIGHLSGARSISTTLVGLVFAILFFLLIAATAGCILALFFYRPPPEP